MFLWKEETQVDGEADKEEGMDTNGGRRQTSVSAIGMVYSFA